MLDFLSMVGYIRRGYKKIKWLWFLFLVEINNSVPSGKKCPKRLTLIFGLANMGGATALELKPEIGPRVNADPSTFMKPPCFTA